MAVTKKDQERAGYAWMYGAQARKDGNERAVPEYRNGETEVWLQGFDDVPLVGAGKARSVSDQLEAELDETALGKPSS